MGSDSTDLRFRSASSPTPARSPRATSAPGLPTSPCPATCAARRPPSATRNGTPRTAPAGSSARWSITCPTATWTASWGSAGPWPRTARSSNLSSVNPESGEDTLARAVGVYAWHGRHHLAHIESWSNARTGP